jgi:integrase
MNIVDAADEMQVQMIHAVLVKKWPKIYGDIWKIGVNLALRISDLLSIKYDDLNIEARTLRIVEQKTGKANVLRLNENALAVIQRRRIDYPDHVWLFQVISNRSRDKPITRSAVSGVFKQSGDMLGLKINSHSMRKSRGMILYTNGVPIEKIAKVLNHSTTTCTLRYLGITQNEVLKTFDDYML